MQDPIPDASVVLFHTRRIVQRIEPIVRNTLFRNSIVNHWTHVGYNPSDWICRAPKCGGGLIRVLYRNIKPRDHSRVTPFYDIIPKYMFSMTISSIVAFV